MTWEESHRRAQLARDGIWKPERGDVVYFLDRGIKVLSVFVASIVLEEIYVKMLGPICCVVRPLPLSTVLMMDTPYSRMLHFMDVVPLFVNDELKLHRVATPASLAWLEMKE